MCVCVCVSIYIIWVLINCMRLKWISYLFIFQLGSIIRIFRNFPMDLNPILTTNLHLAFIESNWLDMDKDQHLWQVNLIVQYCPNSLLCSYSKSLLKKSLPYLIINIYAAFLNIFILVAWFNLFPPSQITFEFASTASIPS